MVRQEESGNASPHMSRLTARTISATSCCEKLPYTEGVHRMESPTRPAPAKSSTKQIAKQIAILWLTALLTHFARNQFISF
jgi:hypothetical protein